MQLRLQQAGFRYQRKVKKYIEQYLSKWPCLYEQWFGFEDLNGQGRCQTDFLFVLDDRVVILEAKLSQTERAEWQLEKLYRPVCERVYDLPTFCVQCCKILRKQPKVPVLYIKDILEGDIHYLPSLSTWHLTL